MTAFCDYLTLCGPFPSFMLGTLAGAAWLYLFLILDDKIVK